MPYYALSCVFCVGVCAMLSVFLMIASAPLWSFLALGCTGVVAIILLLYWELEYIDKCYLYSSQSEKEKLLNQKRHKHRRNIFILTTSTIIICLFVGWCIAAHYFPFIMQ